jgi:arsenate reductase
MTRVYTYRGCDTCRRALKFLKGRGISFTEIPIREQPPTRAELGQALKNQGGDARKLFNTSGKDYREMKLGEKLKGMSQQEIIGLLASNGNLVKRPFVWSEGPVLLGFREPEWESASWP